VAIQSKYDVFERSISKNPMRVIFQELEEKKEKIRCGKSSSFPTMIEGNIIPFSVWQMRRIKKEKTKERKKREREEEKRKRKETWVFLLEEKGKRRRSGKFHDFNFFFSSPPSFFFSEL